MISPPAIPENERGKFDLATEASVNAFLTANGLPANGHTDALFWGAMESNGMPSLSVLICPVPFFLDRSGLTYPELVDLVKTRFVNPTLQGEGDLDYLTRLGIPAADVRNWIVAGIPAIIPAPILNQLISLGENPGFFTTWVKRRRRAIVINTGFESPCDLDRATIMHLDGTLLSPDELNRLFRFIRLWKKLGWNLADMDHAVETSSLDGGKIFETILLLANVKQLHVNTNAPIEEIVCWWQNIPRHGESPLYDRLFRNKAAQLIDPILELNSERTELKAAETATPPTITDHISSLLAAFKLNAQEMAMLRTEIGLDDNLSVSPPLLNITTVSAIYRQVSLARTQDLTIRESISLIRLTGLKVFERPDHFPQGEMLQFVNTLEKIHASGFTITELDYLCREVPQPPGLPGTQRNAWRNTLATIIDGLHAIQQEEPIESDPIGEELKARLTAILGQEDARITTALIYGTDLYTASLAGLPVPFTFPAAIAGRISYNTTQKQLKLLGAAIPLKNIMVEN